jgi:hypothetical protein
MPSSFANSDKTGALKSQLRELVKQYIEYDISGRPINIYTAPNDALDGAPCQLTQYAYDGISTRIQKRLETLSTWDDTWDMP